MIGAVDVPSDQILMKKLTNIIVVMAGLGCFLLLPGTSLAVSKITISPTTATIDEGASQTFTVTLDEPIICENPNDPAQIELTFTSSDPSIATADPSTLTFLAANWYVPQTFTVNTVNTGAYSGSENVTFSTTAVTCSEYYSGFQTSAALTINNSDPAPAPTPSPTPSAPDTGLGAPTAKPPVTWIEFGLLTVGLIGLGLGARRYLRR